MSKFITRFTAAGQKSLILLSFKAILVSFFSQVYLVLFTFFTYFNLASPASLEYKLALPAGLGQGLSSETMGLNAGQGRRSALRAGTCKVWILFFAFLANKFWELAF